MKVYNVWKVERNGDEKRLYGVQDKVAKEVGRISERPLFQGKRPEFPKDRQDAYHKTNTALLFHGTRSVNVSGILRKSLLLPKKLVGVVITGAMFGPGQYYADDWKKSAGYTSLSGSYWSGGSGKVRGRRAFMFLVDVVLGKPFVAPGPRGYTEPPRGYHCVFGKAGRSHVQNNEWIVYRTEQHMLRYLVEFDTR
jgi:poly [ADP-ribose] polymerase